MLKIILIALLPLLFPYSSSLDNPIIESNPQNQEVISGTLEKMIVENGSATLDLNVETLNGVNSNQKKEDLKAIRFSAKENSFFTIIVFNGELRGALPSSMEIIPNDLGEVPTNLGQSVQKFVVESLPFGGQYDLVVRDQESGLIAFNVDGYEVGYNPQNKIMSIEGGRLLISPEFANKLGRPDDSGRIVGTISINVKMRAIEVSQIVDGESQKSVLPAGTGDERNAGSTPGPDVVVGDVNGLAQFGGVSGTRVGLSLGTDSCNFGQVDLNWFQMPNNDHPVIPQNLYRMSGGADNTERFEQIGQSRVKHGFTALTQNICSLGCNGVGGSRLGSGCSDPYSASLNSGSLSSRAWINPFTGGFPRGDSATPPGFSNSVNNRILTEINDLNTSLNAGATYYAEGQYVTPHEYTWCNSSSTNAALCEQNKNLFNNISYRRYNVTGTASPFSFSPASATVRAKSAISAWTGATLVEFRPVMTDGMGVVGYKVTNPSPGVWHYEYAVYNQNMDRAIQSFSIPLGNGITLTNVGFSAPPQHPGAAGDGTFNNLGFSSTPWTQSQTATSMTWNTETFAQNQNANAIRWGTMYNFRFRSNRPPQNVNATIGFYKTGDPITVQVQGPTPTSAAPPRSRADFDGDGKTDVSVFRGNEGNWYLNRSTAGFAAINWGLGSDVLTPGDFDGDNKTDTAIFRANTTDGQPDFYVLNSNGFTVTSSSLGTTGDVPCVADYDADSRADFCVRRPSDNTFYIVHSNGGTTRNYTFGISGDKAVNGDFDGDGKADFGVFRPSNGTWYIARSTDNGVTTFNWGLSTDIPVFADYDGDNKDDIAVFRPSDGIWYIVKSTGGTTFMPFGTNGDVPVPGDYDGDGKDDQAVYRNGIWYMNSSTSGFGAAAFGVATDNPIPRQYLP